MTIEPEHSKDVTPCSEPDPAELVATAVGVKLWEFFDAPSVTDEMRTIMQELEHLEARRHALWKLTQMKRAENF